jgi:hypothetical protein
VGYESYKSLFSQGVERLVKFAYYALPSYQFLTWDARERDIIPPM